MCGKEKRVMANGSIELVGVKEIQEILSELPAKTQSEIIKGVLRKIASTEVVKPLRSILPYSPTTKKKIVLKADRRYPRVFVGPTTDVFWVRFVEGGTQERFSKSGASKGAIPENKKIEPFVDSKIPAIINRVNKDFGNIVDEFMKKKIKRLNKK